MCVIGQCNRTVKGTVNTSCQGKWTERVMYCCLAFCRVNCCFFFLFLFLMKTYNHNRSLVSSQILLRLQTELDSARSYLAADDQWRSKFYYCVDWICHMLLYVGWPTRVSPRERSIQSCGRLIERRRENSSTEKSLMRRLLAYIYIAIIV